nr:MAG TPA: hypothetical protein [Microviridae sp.]
MERSDFLREAFRFGILARSAQRQVLSDLPCLYTLYTLTCQLSEAPSCVRKQIRVIFSNSPSLVHKRTTHTLW